jgi:hypothetical protein
MLNLSLCKTVFKCTPFALRHFQPHRTLTVTIQRLKEAKPAETKDACPEGKKSGGSEAKKGGSEAKKKAPVLKTFYIYRFTKESKKKPHMQKYVVDLSRYKFCSDHHARVNIFVAVAVPWFSTPY